MIEDELFKQEIKGFNLTKDKYEPATFLHKCDMCGEESTTQGYRRRNPSSWLVPYLFICIDCYEELPNKEKTNEV